MVAAIKRTVTVGPGGEVQLRAPELQPGSRAEVIVLVESAATDAPTVDEPARPMASFIGAAKGTFGSVDDVDQFIRAERDQWDR